MTLLYRSEFCLGRRNKPPSASEVAKEIKGNIERRIRYILPTSNEFEFENGNSKVKGICVEEKDKKLIGVQWCQRDQKNKEIIWSVGTAVEESKKQTIFSAELSKEDYSASLTPHTHITTRPILVPRIINKFGAFRKYPIFTKPIPIGIKDVENVFRILNDPQRELPLFLISCDNYERKFVNEEEIAWNLAGIAHTMFTEKFDSCVKLAGLLKRESCYGGAARLYWPKRKNPTEHIHNPYWTKEFLERNNKFSQEILSFLSEITKNKIALINFSKVERAKTRAERLKLETSGDFHALAENYAEENDMLKEIVEKLKQELSSKSEKILGCESYINQLQREINEAKEIQTNKLEIIALNSLPHAVSEFERIYGGKKVQITTKAKKQIKNSPFKKPDQIFKVFRWLGTDYLDIKTGKKQIPLEESCKQQTGLDFRHFQSEVTKGMFPDEYTIQIDGQNYELNEHICKGTSRDPRHTIRIGIAYDPKKERAIVGSIQQHSKTKKT
ncbi:hypothetical protein K9L16_00810 [Candidatus Pacearchaeota archaeon]|nr:hypothetical protein [Candidatus Pacearchaeota archaeon]